MMARLMRAWGRLVIGHPGLLAGLSLLLTVFLYANIHNLRTGTDLTDLFGSHDPQWQAALVIAAQAASNVLPDITGGADMYYAPKSIRTSKTFTLPNGSSVPFPADWNANVVVYTCTIQGQVFFRSHGSV